jgi:aspartyl-tRNA(Asn)/glutamyl-tRNA(Gln) amidotransferase subunit A
MKVSDKAVSIKNHEITALDNLEKFYETIERDNPKINAFLEVKIDEARALAEGIDKKIQSGEKTGKLAGLVVGVKSNINVEDFHITAASKTLKNYLGSYDATVIKRIKEEDGIIIGMTNMDEFAAGSSTETSAFGATDKNPWWFQWWKCSSSCSGHVRPEHRIRHRRFHKKPRIPLWSFRIQTNLWSSFTAGPP